MKDYRIFVFLFFIWMSVYNFHLGIDNIFNMYISGLCTGGIVLTWIYYELKYLNKKMLVRSSCRYLMQSESGYACSYFETGKWNCIDCIAYVKKK